MEGNQLATISEDIINKLIFNTLNDINYFVLILLLDDIKIINSLC